MFSTLLVIGAWSQGLSLLQTCKAVIADCESLTDLASYSTHHASSLLLYLSMKVFRRFPGGEGREMTGVEGSVVGCRAGFAISLNPL